MIKPERMTKIRLSSSKNNLKKVISALYDLKLLHLVDFGKHDFFEIGQPFKESENYSQQLVILRSMISKLKLDGRPKEISNISIARKKLLKLEKEFLSLNDSLNSLTSKEKELELKLKEQHPDFSIPQKLMQGYKSLQVFTGIVPKPFEQRLKKITNDYSLFTAPYGRKLAIVLFVKSKDSEIVRNFLQNEGFSEHTFFSKEELKSFKKELSSVVKEKNTLMKKIEFFKNKNRQFLIDYENTLRKLNDKASAPLKFAVSKNAFVLSGWVPTKKVEKLKEKILRTTNEKAFVETFEEKDAPISLKNPKPLNSFEFFLNLYSLPKYYEIDPSFLVFLTFPLFFGFMLGDVGYGITTLIIFAILRTRVSRELKSLLNILLISSISTIFFGFVFGEFFGLQFIEHPLLHRAHEIELMILISVIVGLIHLNLGFIIGFINKLSAHGLKHAIYEKGSWILLEVGAGLIALDFLGIVSSGTIPGIIILLLSIMLLFKGEGVKGLIELPSLLSNILSYARLFAIGLASVSLALVVNDFATNFFSQGGFMIVAAVMILILGHAINIALGILGPFLHSLRLHYVEFFTKFYEGGGERYAPFGAN